VREQAVPVVRVVRAARPVRAGAVRAARAGAVRAALVTTSMCQRGGWDAPENNPEVPPPPLAPRATALTTPVIVGLYPRDTGGNGPR